MSRRLPNSFTECILHGNRCCRILAHEHPATHNIPGALAISTARSIHDSARHVMSMSGIHTDDSLACAPVLGTRGRSQSASLKEPIADDPGDTGTRHPVPQGREFSGVRAGGEGFRDS
jgi:hypothetical protein